MKKWQLKDGYIILGSIFLTDMAALIQFYIIETESIEYHYFMIPSVVGAVFGTILVYTRHYYEKSKRAESFERAAKTDFLTGALNRYAFYAYINDEIERSKRSGRIFSLAMFDIDDFKKINDIYGHQVGDEVLISFCKLVVGMLRSTDHFNRWGGEEFMVLLPETEIEEAAILAERIRKKVSLKEFGLNHPVTVSIGMTGYRNGDNIETLVERVDKAMYVAKKSGKNRIERG